MKEMKRVRLSESTSKLCAAREGDIVIMDNRGSHKGKAALALIHPAGAKFFLLKYSSDLNPVEQVFAKLERLLREAAARTVDAIYAALGESFATFTPQECANCFKNSGIQTKLNSSCFGVFEQRVRELATKFDTFSEPGSLYCPRSSEGA